MENITIDPSTEIVAKSRQQLDEGSSPPEARPRSNSAPTADLSQIDTLPNLPPCSLDDTEDGLFVQEQLEPDDDDDVFRDQIAEGMEDFNATLPPLRNHPLNKELEETMNAIEAKRLHIASRQSLNQDVMVDMVELKRLEEDLTKAQKAETRSQSYYQHLDEDDSIFIKNEETELSNRYLADVPVIRTPARAQACDFYRARGDSDVSDNEGSPLQGSNPTNERPLERSENEQSLSTVKGSRVMKKISKIRQQNARMLNMGSLLHNDVVADARANQGLPQQPGFEGARSKMGALKALIASIPQGDRDTAAEMRRKINNACKTFTCRGQGSMQADGRRGWRLKGMDSSLESFQLLAAAWGVDRERGSIAPFGGILADTMGYGKTVQMITIMVENRPARGKGNVTTLIVLPASLIDQWMSEIAKHCSDRVMEDVMVYKSGARAAGQDVCGFLRKYRVVLTTYHEVMSNYPKCDPPKHLSTERSKDEWWEKYYEEKKGPFLRMKFHRVILDEAQVIKNHASRTSKACRELSSKYKWILTGTPISNCLEELFPYLNFLGVEGCGSFEQFRHNYAKRNETTSARLDSILNSVMVRRTGADRMFGAPLVKLPNLDHQTISVAFNPIEKAIYDVVHQRFLNKILEWTSAGKIGQMSKSLFVMLIRLRQMCAHILMISPTIEDLLESEDVEKLWSIMKRHSQSTSNMGRQTAVLLQRILSDVPDQNDPHYDCTPSRRQPRDQESIDLTINDSDFDYRGLFYRLLNSGKWDEMRKRSRCSTCNEHPEDSQAKISIPCAHFYCEECIDALIESAEQADTQAECTTCHNLMTGSARMAAMEQIAREAPRSKSRSSPTQSTPNKKMTRKDKDAAETKWLSYPGVERSSSKVQAITNTLQQWINKDANAKIVIFTLWIPMIKLFAKICTQKNWGYQEYTGRTPIDARNRNLRLWKEESSRSQVLLMSMQAGGVGLNLVEANHVIICDPWWNLPVEDQAFSRIYRIGQTKDCIVRKFVIKDGIDTELMLRLQTLKAQECDRVIDGRQNTQHDISELLKLFGPTKRDPNTGEIMAGESDDGMNEFVHASENIVIDDSEDEEVMPTPARPQDS